MTGTPLARIEDLFRAGHRYTAQEAAAMTHLPLRDAGFLLSQLVKTGWLERDEDGSYRRREAS